MSTSAKAATKLSYRDAIEQVAEFTSEISRSTIYRHVKRFVGEINSFIYKENAGTEAQMVIAGRTKCHSQRDEVSFHDVHITLERDVVDEDGEITAPGRDRRQFVG